MIEVIGMVAGNHLRISIVLLALVFGVGSAVAPLRAQDAQVATARDWSPVEAIPQYFPDTLPPLMVADSNRTVHAFATLPLSDDPFDPASKERGIFYRRWTVEGGWTVPNDIMLTPLKREARIESIMMDDAGNIHMVFFGGDEQEANIYYSWAPAALAESAQAWSPPLAIGSGATAPEIAAINGDGGDHLVVVYAGNLGEGNSLYVTYSDDAGVTWSGPELLFSTYALDTKPFDFAWHRGESGVLHTVWNVTDENGQNLAAYYGQLKSVTDRQWSKPVPIDKSVGLGLASLNLVEYAGNVMLIYNNGREGSVAPVMWFKMSTDGGQTFSEPIQPFPDHVGRNGPVSFVVDGNGTLSAFFGQRIPGVFGGGGDMMGMWQSKWEGNSWGPVAPIVSGPSSDSFDPGDAQAVVSQGDVILVTYRTDPGKKFGSTWYTYRVLDAPELPVQPLPTPSSSALRTQLFADGNTGDMAAGALPAGEAATALSSMLPTATPAPTPTVVEPLLDFAKDSDPNLAASPAAPLLGAIVPTVLFVVAALLFGSTRRKS